MRIVAPQPCLQSQLSRLVCSRSSPTEHPSCLSGCLFDSHIEEKDNNMLFIANYYREFMAILHEFCMK